MNTTTTTDTLMDFDLAMALRDNIADAIVISLALAVGWVVVVLSRPPAKDAPAKSPAGIMESVKMFGSCEAPWWHLQLQESLGSSIFQHNLPIRGGTYVLCAAKDQREVMLDKTTDKPLQLYSNFDSIMGRKQMISRSTFSPLFKKMRKSVSHSFSSSDINRMKSICTKYVEEWETEFLEKIVDTDATFDPSFELTGIVFKTIMEAAFEYKSTSEDFDSFASNFEVAAIELTFRQATNPLRKVFGFLIPEVWAAHKCSSHLRGFVKTVLEAYRKNPNKSESTTVIKVVESNPYDMSDEEKVAELLIWLIGGFETTGYTLASTITLLAKHPKEMKDLQQSLLQGDPTQSKDHLKRVITESQRVIPVAAMGSARFTGRDFIFFDEPSNRKVKIPKGASVFLPQITAHQDGMVFEDAGQFKPGRWKNPTKEMTHSILGFALGNRDCPGRSMAIAELYLILSRILSKYEFEVVEEGSLFFFMLLKYADTKLRVKRVKP